MHTKNSILLKSTLLLVSLISFTAIYISYKLNYIVAYNDAAAHLNTARRVIDNLTPGIVQIGSVWLPLLHILEMPFVAVDILWTTGLAGSIVSSISFIGASYFLYKLLRFVTDDDWAAAIGTLMFATNANLVYLQTTAMFEPLLMVLAIGSVYFLTRWSKTRAVIDLIQAAFFTMLATLTRYDGWALFISTSVYVFLTTFAQKRKQKEGMLLLYLFLAVFGIFLWLLYNQLIFSDALYFARGEYSAGAQQKILEARGFLPTKHNLVLSIQIYSMSMILNIGIIAIVILALGVLLFFVDYALQLTAWAPFLLLTPYAFNIISLYLGQSVIWLPMLEPFLDTYFNARYGILMLPAVGFFAGYVSSKHFSLKPVIFILLITQAALFFYPVWPFNGKHTAMITLYDTVSAVNQYTLNSSKYLHNHYDEGLILVSSASADAFIFRAGIPLKNYITEGTGYYWKESLEDPVRHATWVVFFNDKTDRVGRAVGNSESLHKNYSMVYNNQTYQIWKIKPI